MKLFFAILIGKTVKILLNIFKLSKGSSAPGLVALKIDNKLIEKLAFNIKKPKILISATNGKTTTTKILCEIISKKDKVISNYTGANLERGIASALIEKTNLFGKLDDNYLVLEVDEAVLPDMIKKINPNLIILGNLFRDQLDRYGELENISKRWELSIKKINKQTKIILNADDPLIANMGSNLDKVYYFGINHNTTHKMEHAADSTRCPICKNNLLYKDIFFSHLGDYKCSKCNFKRPKLDIFADNIRFKNEILKLRINYKKQKINIETNINGFHNIYNILPAIMTCKILDIDNYIISDSIKNLSPAFGRTEKFVFKNKQFVLNLIKNPTGANALFNFLDNKEKYIIFALNDKIADGTDVSWIWDADFENIKNAKEIICTGIRKYDIALRIKYSKILEKGLSIEKDYWQAIKVASNIAKDKIYIFANYTAMLEIRKILENKKIVKKV